MYLLIEMHCERADDLRHSTGCNQNPLETAVPKPVPTLELVIHCPKSVRAELTCTQFCTIKRILRMQRT